LYQKYTSLPFFLRNHPLAIGFPPLARGTAGWNCTVAGTVCQAVVVSVGSGFANARGNDALNFADFEAPHPPTLADSKRVCRNEPSASHFEHLTTRDLQMRCDIVCCYVWFSLKEICVSFTAN